MSSLQESLVSVGLVSEEVFEKKRKEEAVDHMLDQFERLVICNATFVLTMQFMQWSLRPENKGKPESDFIAYARAEILKRL